MWIQSKGVIVLLASRHNLSKEPGLGRPGSLGKTSLFYPGQKGQGMGVKNSSPFGRLLYASSALTKALVLEYSDRFLAPLVEVWPLYKSQDQEALLEALAHVVALPDFQKHLVLEPEQAEGILKNFERFSGGQEATLERLEEYFRQEYPAEVFLLFPQPDQVDWNTPTPKAYPPAPPRAFNPLEESKNEYLRYINAYCDEALEWGYGQHKEKDNLERDSTWAAWRMVEGLNTNDVAYRWLERTGEEVENATVDQAIKRVLDGRKELNRIKAPDIGSKAFVKTWP